MTFSNLVLGSGSACVLALGCALMGGVYFTFSTFVMDSLAALPKPEGITAMQSINDVILRSPFMPMFFGTSLASLVMVVWGVGRWGDAGCLALVVGGVVYFVGHFLFTAAFNVPLNDALAAVDPSTPEAATVWADYLVRWTRWNHVRMVACLVSGVAFLVAARNLG